MSDNTKVLLTASALVDRLDAIDSEIKIVMNMVAHHEVALVQIEKRVTKLEDKVNGIH